MTVIYPGLYGMYIPGTACPIILFEEVTELTHIYMIKCVASVQSCEQVLKQEKYSPLPILLQSIDYSVSSVTSSLFSESFIHLRKPPMLV